MPDQINDLERCVDEGIALMARLATPFAFIVRQGTFFDNELREPPVCLPPRGRQHELTTGCPRPSRIAVLEQLLAHLPSEAAVIATTGKCVRELFTLADRPPSTCTWWERWARPLPSGWALLSTVGARSSCSMRTVRLSCAWARWRQSGPRRRRISFILFSTTACTIQRAANVPFPRRLTLAEAEPLVGMHKFCRAIPLRGSSLRSICRCGNAGRTCCTCASRLVQSKN